MRENMSLNEASVRKCSKFNGFFFTDAEIIDDTHFGGFLERSDRPYGEKVRLTYR